MVNSNMIFDKDYIERELDNIFYEWAKAIEHAAINNDKFVYGNSYMMKHPSKEDKTKRLLKAYGSDPSDGFAFDTLTSMRSVDAGVNSSVIIWED